MHMLGSMTNQMYSESRRSVASALILCSTASQDKVALQSGTSSNIRNNTASLRDNYESLRFIEIEIHGFDVSFTVLFLIRHPLW